MPLRGHEPFVPALGGLPPDHTCLELDLVKHLLGSLPHNVALSLEEVMDACPQGTGPDQLMRAMRHSCDVFGQNPARNLFYVHPPSQSRGHLFVNGW